MTTAIKKSQSNKSGSVLPLAVVIVLILFFIGMGITKLGLYSRLQTIRSVANITAREAADAGLTRAKYLMRKKLDDEKPNWNNSTLSDISGSDVPLPNCNATYSYDVNGDPNSGFVINSTGKCGSAQKTVHCRLVTKSSFCGIGVKQGIVLGSDINLGTVQPGGELVIRTNSTDSGAITLKPNVTVPGDAVIGPGGNPDTGISIGSGSQVLGDKYAGAEIMSFPSVTVPTWLTSLPATATVPAEVSGNVRFNGLTLGNSQELKVTGANTNIYVDGELKLNNGAKITVMPGTSAILYLNGNLVGQNGDGINNLTDDSTKFILYATDNCTNIALKNASALYGAIYAPNAKLIIYNSGNLIGAYVGNESVEIKNSGTFLFDMNLLNTFANDPQAYFAVGWWWED